MYQTVGSTHFNKALRSAHHCHLEATTCHSLFLPHLDVFHFVLSAFYITGLNNKSRPSLFDTESPWVYSQKVIFYICFTYFKCLVFIPQAKDMQMNYINSKLPPTHELFVLYNSLKQ